MRERRIQSNCISDISSWKFKLTLDTKIALPQFISRTPTDCQMRLFHAIQTMQVKDIGFVPISCQGAMIYYGQNDSAYDHILKTLLFY